MADRTVLKDCRFQAHIGVTKDERSKPQEIIVNLSWTSDLGPSGMSDELTDTVCYHQVWIALDEHIKSREYKLIEALGHTLIQLLFERFSGMQNLRLGIFKPEALRQQNVRSAGIELERTRSPKSV
jgi:7,8-dihydroneopterin aldolase/epimerase/oxygenase